MLPFTVSRALGGAGSLPLPMVQLASFAPWALGGWAVSAVVLVLLRWWRLAAVMLLGVALQRLVGGATVGCA